MRITIIGAGPVGSYAAYLLARKGHQVEVYERKAEIGLPIQCTGILTSEFDSFNLPLTSFLVNTIQKTEVNTPSLQTTIHQKEYIISRPKFDQFLANLAQKAGAVIHLNYSFLRKEGQNLIVKDLISNTEKQISAEVVIAADGPLSPTAKAFGLYQNRINYYGLQAVVEGHFSADTIKTYFGQNICPGLFAWIVPESATRARVGLATRSDPKRYFSQFLKKQQFIVKEIQAGLIPLYNPQQLLVKDNCYLLGDAAGYVKATTLGGLVSGMKQAQILAECLLHPNNYLQQLRPLTRQMKLHLQVRQIMDRFSDSDLDQLISYVNQPRIQRVFAHYTRDNPLPLVLNVFLREPRLLQFAKYLFKSREIRRERPTPP